MQADITIKEKRGLPMAAASPSSRLQHESLSNLESELQDIMGMTNEELMQERLAMEAMVQQALQAAR